MAEVTMTISSTKVDPPSVSVRRLDQVNIHNSTTDTVVVWFSPDIRQSVSIAAGGTYPLNVDPNALQDPYTFWVDPPPTAEQLSGEIDVIP